MSETEIGFHAFKISRMIFVGIDPGANGAIAVINAKQKIVLIEDWPGNETTAADIVYRLRFEAEQSRRCETIKAAIECVHAMPGQGVTSMFKFGTNFGIWRGILAAYSIPFLLPSPQQWQRGIIKKAQDKAPSCDAARRIWPNAILVGSRGGKKDGRCDALLIADWCRRQYIGIE